MLPSPSSFILGISWGSTRETPEISFPGILSWVLVQFPFQEPHRFLAVGEHGPVALPTDPSGSCFPWICPWRIPTQNVLNFWPKIPWFESLRD